MNTESQKTTHSKISHSVTKTGTAAGGSLGPPIGLVDMGKSEIAYFFRVSLHGLGKNQHKMKVNVYKEGRICIQGVILEVAIPSDVKCKYRMMAGPQLCQPGPFTIEFNLPGQVDPRLFRPVFKPDGILEGVILKFGISVPTSALASTSTSTS